MNRPWREIRRDYPRGPSDPAELEDHYDYGPWLAGQTDAGGWIVHCGWTDYACEDADDAARLCAHLNATGYKPWEDDE